jgi:hypothetical protein
MLLLARYGLQPRCAIRGKYDRYCSRPGEQGFQLSLRSTVCLKTASHNQRLHIVRCDRL